MATDSEYPGQGDAWGDFLHFRARVIREFVRDGYDFDEIVRILNLSDHEHAERIFEATRDVD
jgi:hypothetical protein